MPSQLVGIPVKESEFLQRLNTNSSLQGQTKTNWLQEVASRWSVSNPTIDPPLD